jgi:predicted amidophosphoribosyltransferase
MKCPHCMAELPSRKCPECHEIIPLEGRFCAHCGAEIPHRDTAVESSEDAVNFSKRILCTDGTCIGVINEDGFCSECGKPYTGDPE